MNKLELAHDYMMNCMHNSSENVTLSEAISVAWKYAELMLAEDEKRKDKSRPVVFERLDNDSHEPDWEVAPEWAGYWAVDKNGESHWYDLMPVVSGDEWVMDSNADDFSRDGEFFNYNGNWKESLRKRPE